MSKVKGSCKRLRDMDTSCNVLVVYEDFDFKEGKNNENER